MSQRVEQVDLPKTTTTPDVSVFSISQATTATFTELYFQHTFLFFIQVGSKRVLCPINGELIGHAEDLLVFPPGSMVTLENRPVFAGNYRATGVCFSQNMIEAVFPDKSSKIALFGIQSLKRGTVETSKILDAIQKTIDDESLPDSIRRHRLLEPLIWLRHYGVQLSPCEDRQPLSKIRRLIETDLSHPWRSSEVADHFAVSESTMRRWLTKSGQGFAKTLQNTRLEHGLSLLQSTDISISEIALSCGFKTPSHFAKSFRKRFGIKPSAIRKMEH